MLIGLNLQVHDNSDEYTAMTFDSISQMLPFDTPFVIQDCIDEFQRRMRTNSSCTEISWDLMASMYRKDKEYWNNKLASNAVTEFAGDDPDDHHSHHFRAEDVIFMMEAFKLVKNSDGTNLRAVLRNLYPSTLNESAVLVSLAVWKENISLSDSDVDRQSCRRGPIDADVILSQVLGFAFPRYDALRGALRRDAVVAVELGLWKISLPRTEECRYDSNGYHPMSNEQHICRQKCRPPKEVIQRVFQYLPFPNHVIKRGESQPQAEQQHQAAQQPAANEHHAVVEVVQQPVINQLRQAYIQALNQPVQQLAQVDQPAIVEPQAVQQSAVVEPQAVQQAAIEQLRQAYLQALNQEEQQHNATSSTAHATNNQSSQQQEADIVQPHVPSFTEIEGDNINILSKEPIPSETIPIILNLINGRDSSGRTMHEMFGALPEKERMSQRTHFLDEIVVRRQQDSIKRSSLMTLQPEEWLNDEIMNYFCKNIISPTSDDIGIFSSFFFTRLTRLKRNSSGELVYHYDKEAKAFGLGTGNRATKYKESRDIFKLKELYVPINKDNNHWLHLRVIFESKRIELRDSLGNIRDNNHLNARRKYLADMKRYLFDEYHRSEYAGRHTPVSWDVWDTQWSCVDLSNTIPRQENGDDCGVFTLIAISLLAQGITLTKQLYSQSMVDSLNCRLKIVYLLWVDSVDDSCGKDISVKQGTSGLKNHMKFKRKHPKSSGGKKGGFRLDPERKRILEEALKYVKTDDDVDEGVNDVGGQPSIAIRDSLVSSSSIAAVSSAATLSTDCGVVKQMFCLKVHISFH